MKLLRCLLLVGVTLALAVHLEAATIQARLIRASHNAAPPDAQLQDLAPKLKKVFGYDRYHQLSRRDEKLVDGKRARIDLGEGFVIFVTAAAPEGKERQVELEWYSGKASISQQSLKMRPKQQVFIKGPEVGEDWIVLAVTLVE